MSIYVIVIIKINCVCKLCKISFYLACLKDVINAINFIVYYNSYMGRRMEHDYINHNLKIQGLEK